MHRPTAPLSIMRLRPNPRSLMLTRPASSYRPPTTSYTPPSLPSTPIASSSGLPNSHHPMPEDMPREDYNAPTAYTLGMLGRILKYIAYGVVGISVGTLVGVEGLHQYVEHRALAYPAHSAYLDPTDKVARDTIRSDDPAYFAWEEDPSIPSYTGSSSSSFGGTSPLLGFRTRHALRSAWIALEWGSGSTGVSTIGREPGALHGTVGGGSLRGMIGSGGGQQGGKGGMVNKVDTSYAIAEAYLSTAIKLAETVDNIPFPPHLSINRSDYPESGNAETPSRVAVDMLLRHAEVLERMGTPGTLSRAADEYERVLRSLVVSAAPSPSASSATISAGELSHELKQAERLRLAGKISDVHRRIGDLEGAKGWSTWGAGIAGLAGPGSGSGFLNAGEIMEVPVMATKKGWFGSWSSGSTMQHTLQVNSHPVDSASPLPLSPYPLSPALLRATISLLSSHATHLAMSGDLSSAASYQKTILALVNAASPSGPSTEATLQRLWLSQRRALTTMHLAEVSFARGQGEAETLEVLSKAVVEGEEVIRELTTGRKSTVAGPAQMDLGKMQQIRAAPLAAAFIGSGASSSQVTGRPAQRLLRDAQRSSAENWSLLGLLYERAAVSSARKAASIEESHHMQETALDCYERAIGWSKVAYGGDFAGIGVVEDAEEDGGSSGAENYQRSYEQLKSKMEDGMHLGGGKQRP